MRQTDILLVEDEQVIIDAFRKFLKEEGLKIDAVTDAEDAVHRMEKQKYKMVISDLMLPNFSGRDLLKVVSAKMPTTPFVMISGYATLDNAIESFKLGAFDFIPKPFDVDEILGVVYRALDFSGKELKLREEEKARTPDVHFLGRHSWARREADGTIVLGIGETFSTIRNSIVDLEFQPVNAEVKQGNIFLKIKSDHDRVHNVWAPLSGTIVEVNQPIAEKPRLLANGQQFENWLVRMEPTFYEGELLNLL